MSNIFVPDFVIFVGIQLDKILKGQLVILAWNFVRSLTVLLLKTIFHRKFKNRKQRNSTEILLNTATIRGKLNWNWLKFYGERNTGLPAITTSSYKQPSKRSHIQNTELNLLYTLTFLSILKWTEVSLRWPAYCRWKSKKGKSLTITANF